MSANPLFNDVSVTPPDTRTEAQIVAEIKAITSSPGNRLGSRGSSGGMSIAELGNVPGNILLNPVGSEARGPRWTAEDKARHSEAIKLGLARSWKGDWHFGGDSGICGSRPGPLGTVILSGTCDKRITQTAAGRVRRYCSNACRQRAYRQRTNPPSAGSAGKETP